MTRDQKTLARHALGLPNAQKRSYRNRYFTGPSDQAWDAMLAAGQANVEPRPGGQRMFWLTQAGAKAALEPGESLCTEDFPDQELA